MQITPFAATHNLKVDVIPTIIANPSWETGGRYFDGISLNKSLLPATFSIPVKSACMDMMQILPYFCIIPWVRALNVLSTA